MAILIECQCHKKQSIKNKVCSVCGKDLNKFKRTNNVRYWIDYLLPNGKQRREFIGDSIEEARDAYGKRRTQKREKRPIFEILPQAQMTFQELSDWYLNLESVKGKKYYWVVTLCLKKFNKEFGNRIVGDIKTSEIENYQAKRQKEGKAPSTIDHEIVVAKIVINKAFKDNKVAGDVLKTFQNVKRLLEKRNSNQRKRTLSPKEFVRLENSADSYLKPLLRIGYDTGMRENEILSMKWGWISLKERVIKIPKEVTKDNEKREIPICSELYEVLDRLPRGIHDDYYIVTHNGKPIKDFRAVLKNESAKAGLIYGRFKGDGFILHDLRRTFATDMRKAGVAESVIMEITGHSRGQVFDRYNQINMDDKKQAVERLSEYRKRENAKLDANLDQNLDQTSL